MSSTGFAKRTPVQKKDNKFREEYGFRMTGEQLGVIQDAESQFENKISGYSKTVSQKIAEARNQISKAKGKLAEFDATTGAKIKRARSDVDREWKKFNPAAKAAGSNRGMFDYMMKQGKQVPVRIVSGNDIQAVHMLPKDMVDKMMQDKNLNAAWVDGGKNVNVEVRQGGRIRGKEIHEAFNRDNMYREFSDSPDAAKTRQEFQSQIREGAKKLNKVEGEIATAEQEVATAKGQAKSQIQRGEWEVKEAGKERDREIKNARSLAERQKQNQAKNYRKWRDTRRKAYSQLANISYKKQEK